MFYKIGRRVCLVLAHIFFRIEVAGVDNVPQSSGYILIANHRSNWDPILIVHGIKVQVHYMAKVELFQKNKLVGWVLRHLGAFPVERGKGDSGAIDYAKSIITQGEVLGMFPEGTRSKDGAPLRPRSGAALIAHQTGADLLPCSVWFENPLKFRSRIVISYGKLIKNSDLPFAGAESSPHELKAASRQLMDEIIKLLEGSHCV